VESCKKETDCNDCGPPIWSTTTTKFKSSFPTNTVAIIVDVRQQVGAFRIYAIGTGKFLTGVGTEEAGKMVMIPWDNGWNYDTIGSFRLGYMLKS